MESSSHVCSRARIIKTNIAHGGSVQQYGVIGAYQVCSAKDGEVDAGWRQSSHPPLHHTIHCTADLCHPSLSAVARAVGTLRQQSSACLFFLLALVLDISAR